MQAQNTCVLGGRGARVKAPKPPKVVEIAKKMGLGIDVYPPKRMVSIYVENTEEIKELCKRVNLRLVGYHWQGAIEAETQGGWLVRIWLW